MAIVEGKTQDNGRRKNAGQWSNDSLSDTREPSVEPSIELIPFRILAVNSLLVGGIQRMFPSGLIFCIIV
jgi:hypothetical protein